MIIFLFSADPILGLFQVVPFAGQLYLASYVDQGG